MNDPRSELDRLMSRRWSCRAFRPDPVPRSRIERIVETAQKVPSWCNAQPWQLVITSGAETERLRAALMHEAETAAPSPDLPHPDRYAGIYLDRRRETGWALYDAVGVRKGDRAGSARQAMRNFALFDAPHCAIITAPRDLGAYGAVDCGGFVTAFTLAAAECGVATIAQAAVASHAPFLHRHFDIPDDRLIICAISFGYADEVHPANRFRTTRADVQDVVDWRG